ncbi:Uncharacterised protein [Mycobacteroides abscessus]|nr:Uncharacterised protein [Mycobacteroides abscessus]
MGKGNAMGEQGGADASGPACGQDGLSDQCGVNRVAAAAADIFREPDSEKPHLGSIEVQVAWNLTHLLPLR